MNAVLKDGVDKLASYLSQQMAVPNQAAAQSVRIWVSNVASLQTYSAVLNYFKHIAAVKSASVIAMDHSGVLLAINTKVGLSGLAKILHQDHQMQQIALPPGAQAADAYYSWGVSQWPVPTTN